MVQSWRGRGDSEGLLRQLASTTLSSRLSVQITAIRHRRYLGESEQRLVDIACVAGCAIMFMAMDTDSSGRVDFSEFQVLLAACEAGIDMRQQREIWSSFERDHSNQCSMLGMMIGLQKLNIIGPGVRTTPLLSPTLCCIHPDVYHVVLRGRVCRDNCAGFTTPSVSLSSNCSSRSAWC